MKNIYKRSPSIHPLSVVFLRKLRGTFSVAFLAIGLSLCYFSFAEARTWTSAADPTKTFEAKFKSLDGGVVKLVKKNGRLMRVRINILSSEDQEYIKKADSEHVKEKEPVQGGLTVHVIGDNWGYPNAKLAKVLQFSADILTESFEGKKLIDIDDALELALVKASNLKLLDESKDITALAHFLVSTAKGLRVTVKQTQDRDVIRDIIDTALSVLVPVGTTNKR